MAKVLTPEENREYLRLFGEYKRAINRAHEMLVNYGMESKEFAEADAKAGEFVVAMRKLRGEPRGHWM